MNKLSKSVSKKIKVFFLPYFFCFFIALFYILFKTPLYKSYISIYPSHKTIKYNELMNDLGDFAQTIGVDSNQQMEIFNIKDIIESRLLKDKIALFLLKT